MAFNKFRESVTDEGADKTLSPALPGQVTRRLLWKADEGALVEQAGVIADDEATGEATWSTMAGD